MREEILNQNLKLPVSTVITQVGGGPGRSAFSTPTKPIGQYVSEEICPRAYGGRRDILGFRR
jgi:carbamate kinase